jgi:hypothetical protein
MSPLKQSFQPKLIKQTVYRKLGTNTTQYNSCLVAFLLRMEVINAPFVFSKCYLFELSLAMFPFLPWISFEAHSVIFKRSR